MARIVSCLCSSASLPFVPTSRSLPSRMFTSLVLWHDEEGEKRKTHLAAKNPEVSTRVAPSAVRRRPTNKERRRGRTGWLFLPKADRPEICVVRAPPTAPVRAGRSFDLPLRGPPSTTDWDYTGMVVAVVVVAVWWCCPLYKKSGQDTTATGIIAQRHSAWLCLVEEVENMKLHADAYATSYQPEVMTMDLRLSQETHCADRDN